VGKRPQQSDNIAVIAINGPPLATQLFLVARVYEH
jgi:hypothetical protein